MVIDDDPLFRNMLVTALKRDYNVSVASEGSEGYYKALEHPPDLVVLDIQMPGWDGLKTLRAFRSHSLLSRVLIVMLTSDASREAVLAAIEGGAHDYVIKTKFSREDFRGKLKRLLEPVEEIAPAASTPPAMPASSQPTFRSDAGEAPPGPSRVPLDPAAVPGLQEVLDAWE